MSWRDLKDVLQYFDWLIQLCIATSLLEIPGLRAMHYTSRSSTLDRLLTESGTPLPSVNGCYRTPIFLVS